MGDEFAGCGGCGGDSGGSGVGDSAEIRDLRVREWRGSGESEGNDRARGRRRWGLFFSLFFL